jgi:hypothetical protein
MYEKTFTVLQWHECFGSVYFIGFYICDKCERIFKLVIYVTFNVNRNSIVYDNAHAGGGESKCMLLSWTSLRGDSAVSLSLVNHDSSSWLTPRWDMKWN